MLLAYQNDLKTITMDITSLAPIIARLRATIKEELEKIREVKNQAVRSGDYDVSATVRDWEKKVIEMQMIIDPMG